MLRGYFSHPVGSVRQLLPKTAAPSMSPLSSTHTTTSKLKQKILPILQTNINSYSEGQSCSDVIIKAIHSLFATPMAYTPELSFLYLFFKDLFRFLVLQTVYKIFKHTHTHFPYQSTNLGVSAKAAIALLLYICFISPSRKSIELARRKEKEKM